MLNGEIENLEGMHKKKDGDLESARADIQNLDNQL
jgi:hypothetical protein